MWIVLNDEKDLVTTSNNTQGVHPEFAEAEELAIQQANFHLGSAFTVYEVTEVGRAQTKPATFQVTRTGGFS